MGLEAEMTNTDTRVVGHAAMRLHAGSALNMPNAHAPMVNL